MKVIVFIPMHGEKLHVMRTYIVGKESVTPLNCGRIKIVCTDGSVTFAPPEALVTIEQEQKADGKADEAAEALVKVEPA